MKYIVLLLLLCSVMFGAEVNKYVDTGATGSADGSSWTDAWTSLFAAESQNVDLVTATDNWIINCKASTDAADTTAVVWDGWTTNADYDVEVRVAVTDRHDGTRGTGYRIVNSVGYSVTLDTSDDDFITLNGLAVSNGGGAGSIAYKLGTSSKVLNCLAYNSGTAGFYAASGPTGIVIVNCISLNCVNNFYITPTGTTIANCTAMGGTYGFRVANYTNNNLYNCYAGGSATADFIKTGDDYTFALYYCMSEDGTADDWGGSNNTVSIAYSTDNFTNVTSTTEDATLVSGSALIDEGNDYDGETWWPTQCEDSGDGLDIIGTTRGASWDVGAFELGASGASIPIIMTNIKRRK